MKFLDLSLPTPAENLALDEALLEEAEQGRGPSEVLRLWESTHSFVVAGRSSRIENEVRLAACRAEQIPVLRRCSGGAAVMTGPGCLMYAVVLSYERHPHLRIVEQAHRHVLGVLAQGLGTLSPDVEMLGTSDLARCDRKFSGNSLRCKREHLLYHGTILYRFPLNLISRCLGAPPRQPAYRRLREHASFVDNFPATADQLRLAVGDAWQVGEVMDGWPQQKVAELVTERYSQDSWNFRF